MKFQQQELAAMAVVGVAGLFILRWLLRNSLFPVLSMIFLRMGKVGWAAWCRDHSVPEDCGGCGNCPTSKTTSKATNPHSKQNV